ncbi:hypothetical protein N431DRAFT_481549 [Stipitochalara longipes BDJ]|nr:hypothetical protein N431DRAFT_481549 [Stipitochalara longipes BDJ]
MAKASLNRSFMLCYLMLLGRVQAVNNHGVDFLFPTDGQILNFQDTINVTWTSPFPKPILYTFCYNSTTNNAHQEAVQRVTPYNGSQLVQLVWEGVASCNFDLRPNTTAGNGANSPNFIVLPTARAQPTTVGLGTPASTSSGAATTTGAGDSSTSDTGTPVPSSSGGLSSGAKAGIGVGVAVIAIAVIAGLAFFFLRRRKTTSPPAYATSSPANDQQEYYGGRKYQPVDSMTGSDVQMQEMNAEPTAKPRELSAEVTHELPGAEAGR